MTQTMSKGQEALEALSHCRAARLPVPDKVLRTIDECYRHFTEGKPAGAYRPAVEWDRPAPVTLGEAFGVPDHKGQATANKKKKVALKNATLIHWFVGRHNDRLPRSKEGYREAAERLDIPIDQVEAWVSQNAARRRPP